MEKGKEGGCDPEVAYITSHHILLDITQSYGGIGKYSLIFMNITKNSIIVEEEEDKYSLPLSMTFLNFSLIQMTILYTTKVSDHSAYLTDLDYFV